MRTNFLLATAAWNGKRIENKKISLQNLAIFSDLHYGTPNETIKMKKRIFRNVVEISQIYSYIFDFSQSWFWTVENR